MNKFLKKILFFTITVPVFWFLSVAVWGFISPTRYQTNIIYKRGAYGHMYTRMHEALQYGDCDVMVLGSSHAYRGFDPRIFQDHGLKMFNLGSSSQTPVQSKIMAEQNLSNLQPETVIWEVYPYTFELDGVESYLDIVSNAPMNIDYFWFGVKSLHLKVINTTIHATAQDLVRQPFKEDPRKKIDTYVSGGYVEKDIKYATPDQTFEPQKIKFSSDQKKAFEETIQFFNTKNIEVILVFAPINSDYYNSITNKQEIDDYFNSIKKTKYFNFNNPPYTFDDTLHFYDKHHMNQKGVNVFNNLLLQELPSSNHPPALRTAN